MSTMLLKLGMAAGMGLGLATASVRAAPPAFTVESVVRSNQVVPGQGAISLPTFGPGQGQGVLKVAVNNSGAWLANVHVVQTDPLVDEAVLISTMGLFPYIGEGYEGFLSQPFGDTIASGIHSIAINNVGDAGLALGLLQDEENYVNPTSGFYRNRSALAGLEGGVINATGLAAGTTWAPFDADSVVRITDTGRMLIVSKVNESGNLRRAVIVAEVNASGVITSATAVAKEGGPVGIGPDTWVSIAGGGHAAAINNAGSVIFSGTTASGVEGVYVGTGFGPRRGQPSPVVGRNWGELLGAPVDISNNGQYAVRGRLAADNTTAAELETKDAGDTADSADRTFGNGALELITGRLNDDHDVDMFRIRVSDPVTFSATTVPDPGSGFAGAAWDTVLTVIGSPENGTRGLRQSDNFSASVPQSRVTGATLVAGREYYIAISTPKSRATARVWHYATGTFPNYDIWIGDPSGLAVSGGLVYWPDPSAGTIRRSTTGGVLQSDLAAPTVASLVTVDQAGGKIYWADRGTSGAGNGPKIRRSNLDGSNVENIVTVVGFGTLTASDATGLALDLVNGKLYWTRSVYGEINRCNLDGSAAERVIQDYLATQATFPAPPPSTENFAPGAIVVDPSGGKIYWTNEVLNAIERANLDGTGRQSLGVGAGAIGLALDAGAGKLYWSNRAGNRIQRSNLDGSGLEDVVLTAAPGALSLDVSAGRIYWASTAERVIRSALISGSGVTDVVSVGPDVGERLADGTGATSTFAEWARSGQAMGPELPYQIRLTGATFRHEEAIIAKGNQKIVATGDAIPGVAPNRMVEVGGTNSPVRLSDRGDVLWQGLFAAPTTFNNYLFDALFWNGERLMTSMDIPTGVNMNAQKMVNFRRGPYSLDQSDNGEWAAVSVNMQEPPYNFSPQPDNVLRFRFTLPPACPGDFNGSGTVTVQDIFDFLSAYFSNDPSADINGSGTVTVQDIFDFLSAYFAGC